MITVFCQYTVGGFKIFNISKFPHKYKDGVYVKPSEIREGEDSVTDSVTVVRGNLCGLTEEAVLWFSQPGIKIIYKNNRPHNEILYVKRVGTDTDSIGRNCESSFAFIAEGESDCQTLRKLACLFIGDSATWKKKISGLIGIRAVNSEAVLFFKQKEWTDIERKIASSTLNTSNAGLQRIVKGDKYAIVFEGNDRQKAIGKYQYDLKDYIVVSDSVLDGPSFVTMIEEEIFHPDVSEALKHDDTELKEKNEELKREDFGLKETIEESKRENTELKTLMQPKEGDSSEIAKFKQTIHELEQTIDEQERSIKARDVRIVSLREDIDKSGNRIRQLESHIEKWNENIIVEDYQLDILSKKRTFENVN
jgi:uncharacterized coiled-coil protein SlyX